MMTLDDASVMILGGAYLEDRGVLHAAGMGRAVCFSTRATPLALRLVDVIFVLVAEAETFRFAVIVTVQRETDA